MKKYVGILVLLGLTLFLFLTKEPTGLKQVDSPRLGGADLLACGCGMNKDDEGNVEYPPGWETWDKAKQRDWEHGLERAKNTIKKHEQDKVESVLCTLDTMARKGVFLEDAQNAVITLLDHGADSSDYYPLYVFIIGKNQEGIKGKELIEDIIQEIKRLKTRHEELRKKAKEKKDAGSPADKDNDKEEKNNDKPDNK